MASAATTPVNSTSSSIDPIFAQIAAAPQGDQAGHRAVAAGGAAAALLAAVCAVALAAAV